MARNMILEAHRDTLLARLGLRRAPERGVRDRAAIKPVCLGGPRPDMGLAAMPTLFSGMGGVPTSGAVGSAPYGLIATPVRHECASCLKGATAWMCMLKAQQSAEMSTIRHRTTKSTADVNGVRKEEL